MYFGECENAENFFSLSLFLRVTTSNNNNNNTNNNTRRRSSNNNNSSSSILNIIIMNENVFLCFSIFHFMCVCVFSRFL